MLSISALRPPSNGTSSPRCRSSRARPPSRDRSGWSYDRPSTTTLPENIVCLIKSFIRMFSRARNCEIFANIRLKLYWTYLEPGGAVFGPCVVVAVHSAELSPLLRQTLPELAVDTPVNYSEPSNTSKLADSIYLLGVDI